MNDLRKAAQQALEALELWDRRDNARAMLTDEAIEESWAVSDAAIDALRAALAAPDEVAAAVEAEREVWIDFLHRSGFRRCDSAACNCGSWHHVEGWPKRFREIDEATRDDWRNGETLLTRVERICAERDGLKAALAAPDEVAAAVEAEREACAKEVESVNWFDRHEAAAAIRARSKP